MNISEHKKDIAALGSALLVLISLASWHPTGNFVSSPSYWVDEAISVEKARNFLAFGELDVAVAPGTLSGKPYATAAAGPLLTLPLAAFFGAFGIGVAQARVYMLLWLITLFVGSYFFVRRIAGRRAAFFAVLLMATFSPLYANGKTATGDIPGFVALLLALYYLYVRKWYLFSGVLLGIAVTTKPSLYIPVVAVAVLEILLSESHNRLKRAVAATLGVLIILIPWAISLPSHPSMRASWNEAYVFFQNPFPADAVTVLASLGSGDASFLLHSTVVYYAALTAAVALAIWVMRGRQDAPARLMRFGLLFALGSFVLYVRSPGWLRYLLAGSLLLFLIFPSALQAMADLRKWQYKIPARAVSAVLIVLIGLQAVHFLFFSWRTASDATTQNNAFLQDLLEAEETIGFVDAPALASLFDSRRKYQVVRISGNTVLGMSPLAYSPALLPDYIFVPFNRFGDESRREFVDPYTNVLEERYMDYTPADARFSLYKKIR